jgi:predicted outer membrane repeat protein
VFTLLFSILLVPTRTVAQSYTINNCDAATLVSTFSTAASSAANDTITLKAGCTYTIAAGFSSGTNPATVNPETAFRVLASGKGTLTIIGNGARIERSSASGTDAFRFFEVSSGGTLILENLTLANGSASNGGAIFNDGGTVTLRNVTVTGNTAEGVGGGVASATSGTTAGTLTIINSTLSSNSATESGGAVYSDGQMRAVNSTFSGNSATLDGGGIFHTANGANRLTLVQSTLAANSAGRNGGNLYTDQTTTLHNVILADEAGGGDCYKGGSPTITLIGAALVEDASCGLTGSGYLNADPLLEPLANNGGSTFTHALRPPSPALDAGGALPTDSDDADMDSDTGEVLPVDQRGQPRSVGSAADLGAYELTQAFVTHVTSPSTDGTYGTGSSIDLTVNFSQPVQVTGTPQLWLETGDSDASASYSGGSGSTALTFRYSVAAGHASADLDYTTTTALMLNDGTILALDGTAARLTLPSPGASGSLSANKALVIVTSSAPTPVSVTLEQSAAQADPTRTSPIHFTAVFSAPVTGFEGDDIDLSGSTAPGTLTASISEIAPNDGTTYAVSVSGMSGSGQVTAHVKADAVLSAARAANSASTSSDNVVSYDVTAPDTTLLSAPPASTHDSTLEFTFSSDDASATFACRLDGGSYALCQSPYRPETLADGPHSFDVVAVDSVGNADPTPATSSFTVDTTPPDTTLESTPPATTHDSTPEFRFSSPETGVTFQCALDSGVYTACSSPYAVAALADGAHTFAVRAVDSAGNTDPTPATSGFIVDTLPPTVEVSSSAANPTRTTPIEVTISFSEPVSGFTAADLLIGNGSPGELVSSGNTLFTLAITPTFDGTVSVSIAADGAQDAAGNGNRPLASRFEITYDSSAPNTTITSPANNALINQKKPAFVFEADETDTTFTCTLDANSFPCRSPFSHANSLAEGIHQFSVAASDRAGNADPTPASITFTIDTVGPEIYLGIKPNDISATSSVTFGFTSPENGATFECLFGSEAYAPCTSPYLRDALADGRYTFSVRAVDRAGNRSVALSHSFTVDTTAPEVHITEPADGLVTNNASVPFAFSSADSSVSFACRLDTGAFAACTSPFSAATALADGTHSFEVQARDQAGHVASARVSISVDTSAPQTRLDTTPAAVTASNEARFSFSSNESGVRFECSLDAAPFSACSSPFVTEALVDGEHHFQVRALDGANNSGPTPAAFTFVVDTDAPDTSLDSAPGGIINSNRPTFTFSSPDPNASFACKLDADDYAVCVSPYTSAALPDGAHTFSVRAVDSAGNADPTPASASFTVDATVPTVISSQRVHSSPTHRDQVDFNVRFSEAVTGVDATAFTLTVEGLTGAAITEVSSSGDHYVVSVSTGSGDGRIRLDVRADAALRDASGQPLASGYSDGESYTVVRTAPLVEDMTYAVESGRLLFTVSFSTPVSGVDAADFALNTSGVDATITTLSGEGAAYTVVVRWSGRGTLALTVTDDDSIQDEAGNRLGGDGPGNGDYTGPTFDNRRSDDDDHEEEDRGGSGGTAANAGASASAPSNFPAALLLTSLDDGTQTGVRATPAAGASPFGRVLVMDGQFYVNGGQIGNAEVLARGVIAAIDVFSPDGSPIAGTRICLRGTGILLFLDGRTSPRALEVLEAVQDAGMTCGVLPAAGTVVLVTP